MGWLLILTAGVCFVGGLVVLASVQGVVLFFGFAKIVVSPSCIASQQSAYFHPKFL